MNADTKKKYLENFIKSRRDCGVLLKDITDDHVFNAGYQLAITQANEILVKSLSLIAGPSEFNCAIGEACQRAAAQNALEQWRKLTEGEK